jgi:hypothetical protein
MEWWTFNADGTGTMAGVSIRWTTDGGVLKVCATPYSCGNVCNATDNSPYRLSGDSLAITLVGTTWNYTRMGTDTNADVFTWNHIREDNRAEMDGGTDGLVGTWIWDDMDLEWWTFNEDGTGIMAAIPIRWTTDSGMLKICATPYSCGNFCHATEDSPYRLDGDSLAITVDGITWNYTRR